MKPTWLLAPLLILGSILVACSDDDDADAPAAADGVTEVVRQLLAEASPETADGQLLELTRVVIPAGEAIAPHTHPGPQLAVIVYGTLTYTVIDGEATVTRAAASDTESDTVYTSGDQFELRPGDTIYEPTLMVHEAANHTDEPIVIYLSSLFPEGEPAASPVE